MLLLTASLTNSVLFIITLKSSKKEKEEECLAEALPASLSFTSEAGS